MLGLPNKYLLKVNIQKLFIFSSLYETCLDISSQQKLLSMFCKQINRVKNEVDEKLSELLIYLNVYGSKETLTHVH